MAFSCFPYSNAFQIKSRLCYISYPTPFLLFLLSPFNMLELSETLLFWGTVGWEVGGFVWRQKDRNQKVMALRKVSWGCEHLAAFMWCACAVHSAHYDHYIKKWRRPLRMLLKCELIYRFFPQNYNENSLVICISESIKFTLK